MAMASLNASLLAPKGCAAPAANAPTLIPSALPRNAPIGRIAPNTHNKAHETQDAEKKKQEKKTKKKSLRLSASMDKDLRLLAVRNGMSQQALLETAVSDYLDRAYASGDCICRR
jgi:hypothetical protein